MILDMSDIAAKSVAFEQAKEVARLSYDLLSGMVTGEMATRDLELTLERAIEELDPLAYKYYSVIEASIIKGIIG